MAQHRDANIIDFDAARRRRALARLGATRHAASEEACKAIPTHRLEAMTAIAEWHERVQPLLGACAWEQRMSDNSSIEWTDATWNPVTGCSVVSPGCTNCYAMGLAGTRLRNHPSRAGLTIDTKAGPVWNGEVRLNEQWLTQPLKWKRPRTIFVCAHGDLFHEGVPDEWIDRVFAVMALAPQHTFQVLTKRAKRMREYISANPGFRIRDAMQSIRRQSVIEMSWPLPNVWLGVSAEDQKRADERVPELLATPAAVRFVSAEPLLGPIDFRRVPQPTFPQHNDRNGVGYWSFPKIDWIIVGGESGPSARPMQIPWARSILGQCRAAGVACFVKQLGTEPIWEDGAFLNLRHGKGADMSEWPSDLRVQEFPNAR